MRIKPSAGSLYGSRGQPSAGWATHEFQVGLVPIAPDSVRVELIGEWDGSAQHIKRGSEPFFVDAIVAAMFYEVEEYQTKVAV